MEWRGLRVMRALVGRPGGSRLLHHVRRGEMLQSGVTAIYPSIPPFCAQPVNIITSSTADTTHVVAENPLF